MCIHCKSHICKSLWIKASAKCNVNVVKTLHVSVCVTGLLGHLLVPSGSACEREKMALVSGAARPPSPCMDGNNHPPDMDFTLLPRNPRYLAREVYHSLGTGTLIPASKQM